MFVIVDGGHLRHDSHCPLEDVLCNIHNNAQTGRRYEGGSTGDNVWYGQTNFVRIQRYESTLRRYVFKHKGSAIDTRAGKNTHAGAHIAATLAQVRRYIFKHNGSTVDKLSQVRRSV